MTDQIKWLDEIKRLRDVTSDGSDVTITAELAEKICEKVITIHTKFELIARLLKNNSIKCWHCCDTGWLGDSRGGKVDCYYCKSGQ